LHRFCEITGLSKASAWRYEKRGWLRTHLIANRRYVLAADVADFNRRLASDEFAGKPFKSMYRRLDQTKEENITTIAGLVAKWPKTETTTPGIFYPLFYPPMEKS